jgi:hypothetical protein
MAQDYGKNVRMEWNDKNLENSHLLMLFCDLGGKSEEQSTNSSFIDVCGL